MKYYQKTWINNALGFEFFTQYEYNGHRTTNAAETYHGIQHHFYRRKHLSLGEWIITFREVTAAEEEEAMAIYRGQQEAEVRNELSTKVHKNLQYYSSTNTNVYFIGLVLI